VSAKPSAAVTKILVKLREAVAALDDKKRTPVPADAKSLAALKALVGGAIHADLGAFYAWTGNADRVLNAPEGTEWLSVAGAVSSLKMLRKVREADFPGTLIPISTDGGGNYACFDNDDGSLMDWDHETIEATDLADGLEDHLKDAALKTIEQELDDRKSSAALKGKPVGAGVAVARPSTIVRVPRKDLAKLDRQGYAGGARSAALLPDGRFFVGFNFSGEVWDMGKQKQAWWGLHSASWVAAHHRASGRLLIANRSDLGLFDAGKFKFLARWGTSAVHDGDISALAFTADGKTAISGGRGGRLCLWDVGALRGLPSKVPEDGPYPKIQPGKPTAKLQVYENVNGISWLRVSPDDRFVASTAWGADDIRVWDLGKRALAWKKKFGSSTGCATFAPDGTLVADAGPPGEIVCLAPGGRETRRLKVGGQKEYVTALAFVGPDLLAVAVTDGLKLVDYARGKPIAKVAVPKGNIQTLDADGDTILATHPLALFQMK
jgi:WD40 repeat protein